MLKFFFLENGMDSETNETSYNAKQITIKIYVVLFSEVFRERIERTQSS